MIVLKSKKIKTNLQEESLTSFLTASKLMNISETYLDWGEKNGLVSDTFVIQDVNMLRAQTKHSSANSCEIFTLLSTAFMAKGWNEAQKVKEGLTRSSEITQKG